MNNKQIHNKAKKMLAGLFTFALLGGIGYIHQTHIQASQITEQSAMDHINPILSKYRITEQDWLSYAPGIEDDINKTTYGGKDYDDMNYVSTTSWYDPATNKMVYPYQTSYSIPNDDGSGYHIVSGGYPSDVAKAVADAISVTPRNAKGISDETGSLEPIKDLSDQSIVDDFSDPFLKKYYPKLYKEEQRQEEQDGGERSDAEPLSDFSDAHIKALKREFKESAKRENELADAETASDGQDVDSDGNPIYYSSNGDFTNYPDNNQNNDDNNINKDSDNYTNFSEKPKKFIRKTYKNRKSTRGHYYHYTRGHWVKYRTGHYDKDWQWIPNRRHYYKSKTLKSYRKHKRNRRISHKVLGYRHKKVRKHLKRKLRRHYARKHKTTIAKHAYSYKNGHWIANMNF